MQSQKEITYSNLKPNISNAIKESCPTADAVIYKIADEVHQIHTMSVEPGVEIAKDLSILIDTTIKGAVNLGGDLSVIIKGILVGAFRSNRSIRQEAHKTMGLLVEETLQSIYKYKGNVSQVIEGFLAGAVIVAKEQNLNVREALIVTVESMILSAKKIGPQFAEGLLTNIPKEYNGLKVTP